VALRVSEDIPLVIAANRDEYFARETAPAAWWGYAGVDIFGGRDLEKGGTWLGIRRTSRGPRAGPRTPGLGGCRVALVTNVRDFSLRQTGSSSRGWLVRDALAHPEFPPMLDTRDTPAFNLLVYGAGDHDGALHYLRDGAAPTVVSAGFHALSNARLDTPWPKVESALRSLRTTAQGDVEALFRILSDDVPAPDDALPHTGVPLEVERALSPPFVRLPERGYGTRCSTVIVARVGAGELTFEERTFDSRGKHTGTVRQTV